MMVAGALIGAGLGIGSSVLGGKGAKKAAKAQQAALIDAQNKALAMAQPYADFGEKAMNPLLDELGLGSGQAYQNPLLAQVQDQTLRSIQQRQAASGQRYSGDTSAAMAQGLLQPALDMQQQRIGNLMGVLGVGQGAASGMASTYQNFASPIAQAGSDAVAAPYLAKQQALQGLSGFAGMLGKSAPAGTPGSGYMSTVPISTPSKMAAPLGINPLMRENFRFYNFGGM